MFLSVLEILRSKYKEGEKIIKLGYETLLILDNLYLCLINADGETRWFFRIV